MKEQLYAIGRLGRWIGDQGCFEKIKIPLFPTGRWMIKSNPDEDNVLYIEASKKYDNKWTEWYCEDELVIEKATEEFVFECSKISKTPPPSPKASDFVFIPTNFRKKSWFERFLLTVGKSFDKIFLSR